MSQQSTPSRGRESGRGSRNREPRTPQGRGNNQSPGGPVKIHNTSGVPFGYVPAYLPGSASLVEELNQRVMIVLRDGKHLIGTLASYDQFSNMILQETVERRIVNAGGICYYHDVPLGVYVLRGDSMVLMGQLNEMQERAVMREISLDELERMEQAETREKPLVWDFDNDLVA